LEGIRNLKHASFFFIDIVGLSNPLLSTISQASKIRFLNDSISKCKTYETAPKSKKIVFPTGDGLWIAFFDDIEKPIKLAIELHKKLNDSKDNLNPNERIEVRIGCHIGDVFFVNDLNGTINLWGPGIIMARRLMDTGGSGHILMTSTMADNLIELSKEYRKIIHPIHDFKIKHGEVLLVYSVHGDCFGNSNRPQRGTIVRNIGKKILEQDNHLSYHDVRLILNLKDPKTNRFKISRSFCVENLSEEPIFEIFDKIQTSYPNSFSDLNVKGFDENDEVLELGGIYLDTKYKKEYSLKLNKPIFQNDKKNDFTISYETILPSNFFEDFLQIGTTAFAAKFIFPTNCENIDPKFYLLRYNERQKLPQQRMSIQRGVTTQISWDKITELNKGDLVRVEW